MFDVQKLRQRVFAFKFGAFRVATFLDAVDIRTGLGESFAIGQPADAVRELAGANFIDADSYEHLFIPTLVDTGSTKVLFDTGLGAPDGALVACLKDAG